MIARSTCILNIFSKETVAESDSDSEDEGIGLTFGGKARHDLMMSDEKVMKHDF